MDEVKMKFEELLASRQLLLSPLQWDQFDRYYKQLVAWNEKMNLTAITEREQVFVKHFFDSISLSFFIPLNEGTTIADIGSGAGFPSLPLKIMFPHLKVTIVDSLNKRISFLQNLVTELNLSDVTCIHGRAEDVARLSDHRDAYDLVTARAVARLNVLSELCLPFAKTNGLFVAMKGADPTEELAEARFSIREMKSDLEQTNQFELPVEQSARHLICIRKLAKTPAKYPRKAGLPLKQPLL